MEEEEAQVNHPRKRSTSPPPGVPPSKSLKSSNDKYCWICHKEDPTATCKTCPRSYHSKCMNQHQQSAGAAAAAATDEGEIVCPECVVVMAAENVETRAEIMRNVTMDDLMSMLEFICSRMRGTPGVEPFLRPVDPSEAVDYYEYVTYPMDIQQLEKNIRMRQYGSTEAFMADAQWIVHNSIVFNSVSSPYTLAAKKILKVCRSELSEIETCPECYRNAHTKIGTWFLEGCHRPHILVWAKLKGFPFWPAKAMKIKEELVDVRFFGQHDRAWVNLKDCYLFSNDNPSGVVKKSAALQNALDELNEHVQVLKERYGEVKFAPAKTHLGEITLDRIRAMLPGYTPEEPPPAVLPQRAEAEAEEEEEPSTEAASDKEDNDNSNPPVLSAVSPRAGSASPAQPSALSPAAPIPKDRAPSPSLVSISPIEEKPEVHKTMELMTNLSSAQPGARFNISKDISISAVEGQGQGQGQSQTQTPTSRPTLTRPKLETGAGKQRYVMSDGQIRVGMTRGQTHGPRMTLQQQQQQGKLRVPQRTPVTPRQSHGQGGITLPGGTITVTPLTTNFKATTNGSVLPISVLPPSDAVGGKSGLALAGRSSIGGSALSKTTHTIIHECQRGIESHLKKMVENLGEVLNDDKASKEMMDMAHNHDIALRELRLTMESEKKRALNELRRQLEVEKNVAIEETKKKQWCAQCGSEALFYCCWNTSYCGYTCQESHWPSHMTVCSQAGGGGGPSGGAGGASTPVASEL